MTPRMSDISFREIEAERRQPRPGLLDRIEEAAWPQPISTSRKLR